jgi:molybdopterin converting factor small subunit
MPTVMIPPVLRSQTGGDAQVAAQGSTVGEVLRALADAHPGTRSQLFADGGDLNRYVNVYLNDEDVRVLDGLETQVSSADTVVILPAMAGGRQRAALRMTPATA